MKKIIPMLLIAFLVTASQIVKAQKNDATAKPATECKKDGKCCSNIPDLTDEQKQKIEAICVPHKKEMQAQRNVLNEKQAHLKTLQGSDKPDMDAINKTIDEIAAIKADMAKKCAANNVAIKALLNEKQQVAFNAKSHNCCGNSANESKCCKNPKAANCKK